MPYTCTRRWVPVHRPHSPPEWRSKGVLSGGQEGERCDRQSLDRRQHQLMQALNIGCGMLYYGRIKGVLEEHLTCRSFLELKFGIVWLIEA